MTEPMPMPPPDHSKGMAETHAKSKGARLFDRITYVGIAGVGTFIVTVPLAYELEHHPSLKPYFEKAVHGAETVLNKLPITVSHKTARYVVKTSTLMQGGNAMLLPVWGMEHFKVPIVRGLNAMVGDKTPEEQIEEAPKQTSMSLLKSRGLAWLLVFGSLTGVSKLFPETMKTFEKETGQLVCTVTGNRATHRNVEEIVDGVVKNVPVETRTYGYGKIAALDVFATAAAATLLYLGGHFFARRQEERKELREEHKPVKGEGHRLTDAFADAAVLNREDAPTVQVSGTKQHDGMAREAALAPQL